MQALPSRAAGGPRAALKMRAQEQEGGERREEEKEKVAAGRAFLEPVDLKYSVWAVWRRQTAEQSALSTPMNDKPTTAD